MSSSVGQWRWKSSRNVGQSGFRPMHLEIAQRKREAVVDADQRRRVLGQPLDQPFGDAAPRPVFARRWRRQHLDRRRVALGQIDAQTLQARGRRLRARIVDADISREGHYLVSTREDWDGLSSRLPACAPAIKSVRTEADLWVTPFDGYRGQPRSYLMIWPGVWKPIGTHILLRAFKAAGSNCGAGSHRSAFTSTRAPHAFTSLDCRFAVNQRRRATAAQTPSTNPKGQAPCKESIN